jgi:hypothetical protein
MRQTAQNNVRQTSVDVDPAVPNMRPLAPRTRTTVSPPSNERKENALVVELVDALDSKAKSKNAKTDKTSIRTYS